MNRELWSARIERSEPLMMGLAVAAVLLYLADLAGLFAAPKVWSVYFSLALLIDVVFVADFVVKLVTLRRAYVRSPWMVVDLISALPVLSTLSVMPGALEGLRFVRTFRMLRALRMLRAVQTLRVFRAVASRAGDSPEAVAYRRTVRVAVLLYAVVFVGVVGVARWGLPHGRVIAVDGIEPDQLVEATVLHDDGTVERVRLRGDKVLVNGDLPELYLVLGSLLGMMLILVITRYQIPALWSRQMRELLNVALPEQVAAHFVEHPESYDESVRAPATVLFCDIKGFTSTVEHLELDEVKRHLEAALDAVVDAHLAQGLIIDKFIGDAVMSFSGGNITGGTAEENAYRVVRGALDGLRALRAIHDPWFNEIKMGGASGADILIGAFGTSKRLSYTVLGDRVNLAARLEASCNAVGVQNLFCERTRDLTQSHDDVVWRRIGWMRVQGKAELTVAFEAFDARDDVGWIPAYHSALEAFEQRRFAEALGAFEAVLAGRPDDAPSARYRDLAAALRDAPPDEGWRPVLETRK